MTVRHLLNQTSGFSTLAGNASWDSQDEVEAIVRRLHTVGLSQPVGGHFQYSNNGDTGRFHAMLTLAPERGLAIVLLANASGLEHLVAVDETARGVLSLLMGRSPAALPSNCTLFRLMYWIVLFSPVMLLRGIARGWQRWRRGDFHARVNQPRGWRKRVGRIL